MKPPRSWIRAASLAALLVAALAHAESGTTKERARLRQGPSGATDALGDVEPGTNLELLGESAGWRQVRTPDGRVGWIWAEHLAPRPAEAKPAGTVAGARTLGDDVRDLRADVTALTQRPAPATAADLERVRQELERLSAAERDLARRLDDRVALTPVDPPPEGAGTLWPALLVGGAALGFAASRLLQGRRDRRQRHRLRL